MTLWIADEVVRDESQFCDNQPEDAKTGTPSGAITVPDDYDSHTRALNLRAAVRTQVMCCSRLSGRLAPLTGISPPVPFKLGRLMAASHKADPRGSDVAMYLH